MSAEGEDEGGGGHHGGWIVTYSDMITLLMTMFIVIVTFGSKDKDGYSKKNDSIVGGKGGLGATGENAHGADRSSILVRVSPLGRAVLRGSEIPPIYSDPTADPIESVMNTLTTTPPGKLSDNFQLKVPIAFVLAEDNNLSEQGRHALQNLAEAITDLPYDLVVEVEDTSRLAQACRVTQFMFQGCGIHPSRLAVGVRPGQHTSEGVFWLVLVRNR